MLDAGIVDDDVDLAEAGDGALDHHVDGVAVRHVGAVIGDVDVVFVGERGALRLDLGRIAEAVEHDGGAALRQGAWRCRGRCRWSSR